MTFKPGWLGSNWGLSTGSKRACAAGGVAAAEKREAATVLAISAPFRACEKTPRRVVASSEEPGNPTRSFVLGVAVFVEWLGVNDRTGATARTQHATINRVVPFIIRKLTGALQQEGMVGPLSYL